jgi:hypothetical protein
VGGDVVRCAGEKSPAKKGGVGMVKLISLVTRLYHQVQKAKPKSRDRLLAIIREVRDSGVIPLGMRKAGDGSDEYLWLVHDRKHFDSNVTLAMYLRDRSPAGVAIAVIEI